MATVFKRGGQGNRAGQYYVSYFDHTGERVTKSARTADKTVALRIAAKLEADAALRRDGVVDAQLDGITKQSKRPIEDHLTDYEAKLRAADRTDQHVGMTIRCSRAICTFAGFEMPADITADGVNRYALHLRKIGRAARTIQSHINAIKSFTKWLAEHLKLPRDPLLSVRGPNPTTGRVMERRMLLPDEWPWLRDATKDGPDRHKQTGHERFLLYATAIQTGLRAKEMRQLSRGRMFLDSEAAYIACKAGTTKNRKTAKQYVEPQLAGELRDYLAARPNGSRVFPMPHETNTARILRDDLAEARAAWLEDAKDDVEELTRREASDFLLPTNHEGECFDFHSLRHTCGAWLALAGEHPKVVQTIMRHSQITLTMDTYGHLFPGQAAEAVGRFGHMLVTE